MNRDKPGILAGSLLILIAIYVLGCLLAVSPAPSDRAPLITIERTGGFAGLSEKVLIFPDGSTRNDQGQAGRVSPGRLERFVRWVEGNPAPARGPNGLCNDCYAYRIIIRDGHTARKFVFEDPVASASGIDSENLTVVRQFLSDVFKQSARSG